MLVEAVRVIPFDDAHHDAVVAFENRFLPASQQWAPERSRRWDRDKTDTPQQVFFNGCGYETWENIWGIWNQIPDRDAEALRRIAKIERKFASALVSPDWEPHTPVLQPAVYASKFPAGDRTLWTFINRNEYDVSGRQIQINDGPNIRYYDLWNGVELKPERNEEKVTLSFPIEAHGYGAILATKADLLKSKTLTRSEYAKISAHIIAKQAPAASK